MCVLCSLVTAVSCAKTAEPIEMPFGDVFSDGPKEPYLGGDSDPPRDRGSFGEACHGQL